MLGGAGSLLWGVLLGGKGEVQVVSAKPCLHGNKAPMGGSVMVKGGVNCLGGGQGR